LITKNQKLSLTCDRLGADLEGVCRHEGLAVFVPGALPGETLDALVVQVRPQYAFGKLLSLTTISPDRCEPFCPVYAQCGGCSGQHMRYEATLKAKRAQVLDCLNRIGGLNLSDADVPVTLGADDPLHGRNKTSLPVGGTPQNPMLGFYRRRSHDIIPITNCPVTMADLNPVIAVLRRWIRDCGVEPYREETHRGLLRHVVVRSNRKGDVLVLLSATSANIPEPERLAKMLAKDVPGYAGLHITENRSRGNVILGDSCLRLDGASFIIETLLDREFEISPLSFFQVHPTQTEKLYRQVLHFAALQPSDTVVDAYAGAGTIALCMAGHCSRVVGLEVLPQAVESARRNAARNDVHNAVFYAATVEDQLPKLIAEGLQPDVIVLDPPRKGVEPSVIQAILEVRPRRVVYVSCHVATQARDAALLAAGGYRFAGCQPVDLFCYASDVENVLCMVRDE